jgi:predicted Zn-dependent protease
MDCNLKNLICVLSLTTLLNSPWCYADNFRARWHSLDEPAHTRGDVAAEVKFGREVAAYILGRETLLENTALTRYINLVGKSLAMHSARSDLEFHFGILQNESINAYSTPGGYVFITTGALNLVEDESELAAILAHEIAHVDARHIVKEMDIHGTDSRDLAVFSRLLSASNETTRLTLTQAINSTLSLLFKTGYKISDELEADRTALLILADSGYDPLALPRFLRRAENHTAEHPATKKPTHPSSKERFLQLQSVIDEERFSSQMLTQNRIAVMQNRFSNLFPME